MAAPSPLTIATRPHLLPLMRSPSLLGALKSHSPSQPITLHSIGHLTTLSDEEATPLHDFEDESLWTHELRTLLEDGQVDVIAVAAKDLDAEKIKAPLRVFTTIDADGGEVSLAVRQGDQRVEGLLAPLLHGVKA